MNTTGLHERRGSRRLASTPWHRPPPAGQSEGSQVAGADREEAKSLRRLLRFTRLQHEVSEAQRTAEARQRLELQLRLDSLRYQALSTGSRWRAA